MSGRRKVPVCAAIVAFWKLSLTFAMVVVIAGISSGFGIRRV
jgi:hypothetical protein